MSIPIHSDLQRRVTSECLHRLWRKAGFYPGRHSEAPKRVPIKATGRCRKAHRAVLMSSFKLVTKSIETALHQVVITYVVALPIWKDQVIRRFEFRFQFPSFQHSRKLAGYRNGSHASHAFRRPFFAVRVNAAADVKLATF